MFLRCSAVALVWAAGLYAGGAAAVKNPLARAHYEKALQYGGKGLWSPGIIELSQARESEPPTRIFWSNSARMRSAGSGTWRLHAAQSGCHRARFCGGRITILRSRRTGLIRAKEPAFPNTDPPASIRGMSTR